MIIDFHTHIVPKPFRQDRDRFFHSEPAFKLLYNDPKAKLASVEDLIRMMDEQEIDISVVFGFPWKTEETFRLNNDYVAEAVAKYPKRVKGFGCFDLESSVVPKETERCIKNGLCGIGELAFYESGIDHEGLDRLEPVMDICHQHRLPILIHTNEPIGHMYPGKTPVTLKQIYDLALRFPDNNIVLAHWGGGIFFYELMKRDVSDALKNIYYDTAATPFLYRPSIYNAAINLAGVDKIVFASDYPLLKPARYFKEYQTAQLTENQISAIKGLNASKLLNLG